MNTSADNPILRFEWISGSERGIDLVVCQTQRIVLLKIDQDHLKEQRIFEFSIAQCWYEPQNQIICCASSVNKNQIHPFFFNEKKYFNIKGAMFVLDSQEKGESLHDEQTNQEWRVSSDSEKNKLKLEQQYSKDSSSEEKMNEAEIKKLPETQLTSQRSSQQSKDSSDSKEMKKPGIMGFISRHFKIKSKKTLPETIRDSQENQIKSSNDLSSNYDYNSPIVQHKNTIVLAMLYKESYLVEGDCEAHRVRLFKLGMESKCIKEISINNYCFSKLRFSVVDDLLAIHGSIQTQPPSLNYTSISLLVDIKYSEFKIGEFPLNSEKSEDSQVSRKKTLSFTHTPFPSSIQLKKTTSTQVNITLVSAPSLHYAHSNNSNIENNQDPNQIGSKNVIPANNFEHSNNLQKPKDNSCNYGNNRLNQSSDEAYTKDQLLKNIDSVSLSPNNTNNSNEINTNNICKIDMNNKKQKRRGTNGAVRAAVCVPIPRHSMDQTPNIPSRLSPKMLFSSSSHNSPNVDQLGNSPFQALLYPSSNPTSPVMIPAQSPAIFSKIDKQTLLNQKYSQGNLSSTKQSLSRSPEKSRNSQENHIFPTTKQDNTIGSKTTTDKTNGSDLNKDDNADCEEWMLETFGETLDSPKKRRKQMVSPSRQHNAQQATNTKLETADAAKVVTHQIPRNQKQSQLSSVLEPEEEDEDSDQQSQLFQQQEQEESKQCNQNGETALEKENCGKIWESLLSSEPIKTKSASYLVFSTKSLLMLPNNEPHEIDGPQQQTEKQSDQILPEIRETLTEYRLSNYQALSKDQQAHLFSYDINSSIFTQGDVIICPNIRKFFRLQVNLSVFSRLSHVSPAEGFGILIRRSNNKHYSLQYLRHLFLQNVSMSFFSEAFKSIILSMKGNTCQNSSESCMSTSELYELFFCSLYRNSSCDKNRLVEVMIEYQIACSENQIWISRETETLFAQLLVETGQTRRLITFLQFREIHDSEEIALLLLTQQDCKNHTLQSGLK